MAIVTQGTLKHMRDDMFDSMERLPLRFFDTHPHGAIMSTYTNDTDAIRQLIGQSIPTLIQSGLTIIVLIGTMLYYSVWLFLVVLVVGGLMAFLTGKLGGLSGRFMKAQQAALADEEGFIEEMMDRPEGRSGLQPRAGRQGRVRRVQTRNSSTPRRRRISTATSSCRPWATSAISCTSSSPLSVAS